MDAAANADPSRPPAASESPGSEPSMLGELLDIARRACLRRAMLTLLLCSFVQTASRVRDDPWDLAFVVFVYADLGMIFLCLRLVEQLTPASPPGERRRLQFAVWALSTVLTCAFAYRVCKIMPAALVVDIWCMTASIVGVRFYCLVVYDDRGLIPAHEMV